MKYPPVFPDDNKGGRQGYFIEIGLIDDMARDLGTFDVWTGHSREDQ